MVTRAVSICTYNRWKYIGEVIEGVLGTVPNGTDMEYYSYNGEEIDPSMMIREVHRISGQKSCRASIVSSRGMLFRRLYESPV